MSELRREAARDRTKQAIYAIEAKTCAEIVVVMRRASGHYLYADLIFGAIVALVVLCLFLYHPAEFDFTWFPLEQAAAFAAGAVLCDMAGERGHCHEKVTSGRFDWVLSRIEQDEVYEQAA